MEKDSLTDLKLVPIEEIIAELFDRTDSCIVAYTRTVDAGAPEVIVNHDNSEGWLHLIGLCEAAKDNILKQQLENLDAEDEEGEEWKK